MRKNSKSSKNRTRKRMDNVLIVVDELEGAESFFIELGLTLEGERTAEGPAAANPAIALRLQSNALVGRAAEVGSLGVMPAAVDLEKWDERVRLAEKFGKLNVCRFARTTSPLSNPALMAFRHSFWHSLADVE